MTELFDSIAQFHFLRPWWLLAVLPASALVVLLWRRKASFGIWENVISPHLLPHLMQGSAGSQSRAPLVMLLICWVLACIALAGPTWRKLPEAAQKKIDAQVIVLDLSLSMYAADLPPSRLMRTRMKLTDLLARSEEGLTALVVFAGTPHVVTPLTDDTNTIQSMISSLSPEIMPIKGSDPVAAVKRALEVFKQGGLSGGRILLMTDSVPDDFVAALEPVITSATPVSILGIGTAEGAPITLPDGSFVKEASGNVVVPRLDIDRLKQAARKLGGRFSTLSTSDDDLNYLLANNNPFADQQIIDAHREFDVWDEAGPWLVVLLLPLAAAGYRRGWLGAMLLPVLAALLAMATPRPAQAFEWTDLWQTQDQQAQQLLEQGKAADAAKKFTRPDWKGASEYRGGNYEGAADQFRRQSDANGYYNLGNALTELGQYDDAITAYEKSLQLDPANEDAKHNADIARKRKEQQQQQQQNGGNNSDKNKKGDDEQNSDQKESDPNKQDDQKQDEQKQDQNEQQDQQNQDQKNQNQQNQNPDNQQPESQQNEKPEQQDQQSPDEEQKDPAQQDQQDKQNGQQNPPPKPESEQEGGEDQPPPAPVELKREGLQSEDQQALEQWLRRVPDDPGGLLRRKFERETQLRKTPPGGESTW